MIDVDFTDKEVDQAFELLVYCQNFIRDKTVYVPESIYQSDRVSLALPEFVKGICDIVGYHEQGDEDDY